MGPAEAHYLVRGFRQLIFWFWSGYGNIPISEPNLTHLDQPPGPLTPADEFSLWTDHSGTTMVIFPIKSCKFL